MKRIIAVLAIAFISQLAFAQESKPAEADKTTMEKRAVHKKEKHRKHAMLKELNLNEDQKAKMKEMKVAGKERRAVIKHDSKLTDEQKKEQMKALKEENKKNMQTLLTGEQKAKMKEMKSKCKEEKKDHKKMKHGKPAAATTKEEVKESTTN